MVSRLGVMSLAWGVTIADETCLDAKHHKNAEPSNQACRSTSNSIHTEISRGSKSSLSAAAIISCASWASCVLHPLAAGKGIFHIAIGSAIIERSRPGHTVRFTIDAKQEEQQLAEYLSRFNRIAIFNMDNDYGNNWADIIRNNLQDKIVTSIAYDPQDEDFSPALFRIKEKDPDVLVLLSTSNGARIAKQARAAGITAQLVGTRPIERPELLEKSPYTNGLVYTYPSHSFKHHLIKDYEKAYKTVPAIFGIEAFDAMTTLVRAISEGNGSPEALFN